MADPLNLALGEFAMEATLFDTVDGRVTAAIPGDDWGYLGTQPAYSIKVAGYYLFRCEVTFDVSAPTGTLMKAQLGIAHMSSTGAFVDGNRNFSKAVYTCPPFLAAPVSASDNTVSLAVTYMDYCNIGDLITPFAFDLNPYGDGGTETYFDAGDVQLNFFEGAMIGP